MGHETGVSQATLRRLPIYLHLLRHHKDSGAANISCSDIGKELGLDPTQVRKDMEATNIVGKPRVGFDVLGLIDAIEDFLGFKKVNEAFLAGTGNLGRALLGYNNLKDYGMKIVATFDADLAKIGTEVYGRQVLPIDRMASLAQRMHVLIGIITAPGAHAQAVADMMIAGGMRAIRNFAPVSLRLPAHVIVQNVELYYSLAALSRKLAATLKETPTERSAPTHASDTTATSEPVAPI